MLSDDEDGEFVEVNLEDARRIVENATVRQDAMDRQALLEDINREAELNMNFGDLGGRVGGGDRPSLTPPDTNQRRGRNPDLGTGPRPQENLARSSGRTPAAGSGKGPTQPGGSGKDVPVGPEPQKKKRRKLAKTKTSDLLPESDWPTGFTKTMVDGYSTDGINKVLERQLKEREMSGKDLPLPG